MTPLYSFLAIGLFLIAAELLFWYRTRLIADHRQLARNIIIGYTSLTFWEDVQRFNSFGTYDEQFWNWRKWGFSQFYQGVLNEQAL